MKLFFVSVIIDSHRFVYLVSLSFVPADDLEVRCGRLLSLSSVAHQEFGQELEAGRRRHIFSQGKNGFNDDVAGVGIQAVQEAHCVSRLAINYVTLLCYTVR